MQMCFYLLEQVPWTTQRLWICSLSIWLADQFHCMLNTHWVRGCSHAVQRSCELLRGIGNQTQALIVVTIHKGRDHYSPFTEEKLRHKVITVSQ